MFLLPFQISQSLVDNDYRHVHHADSLKLLEECRLRYLDHIGFPNSELIAQGLYLVISELSVQYKRELFAERIEISCENPRRESKILYLQQRVFKASGKVAITAHFQFHCLSSELKRAVAAPEQFIEAFLSIKY